MTSNSYARLALLIVMLCTVSGAGAQAAGSPSARQFHDLVAALERNPDDSTTASTLADYTLDAAAGAAVDDLIGFRQQIADQLYRSAYAGIGTIPILRACTTLALSVGDPATARFCSGRALAAGMDSAWHQARLGWLAALHAASPPVRDTLLPTFLGPLFRRCPPWTEQNGHRSAEVAQHCSWATGDPGEPIVLTARFYRLWHAESGVPTGLFSFGFTRARLSVDRDAAAEATVTVEIRQWDDPTQAWSDTVVTIPRLPVTRVGDMYDGAGFLEIPPALGPSSWSLSIRQPGRYGRVSVDGNLPLAGDSIALSDLIIGVAVQGLRCVIGGDTVILARSTTVQRHDTLQLFFQTRNIGARTRMRSVVALRAIQNGVVRTDPVLSIAAPLSLAAGVAGVHRVLGIDRVASGSYQLSVTLTDQSGSLIARRATTVLVH